jgi:hypothetical protein
MCKVRAPTGPTYSADTNGVGEAGRRPRGKGEVEERVDRFDLHQDRCVGGVTYEVDSEEERLTKSLGHLDVDPLGERVVYRRRLAREHEIVVKHRPGDAEVAGKSLACGGGDFVRTQNGALSQDVRQPVPEEYECHLAGRIDTRHVRLDERNISPRANPIDQRKGFTVCGGRESARVAGTGGDVRFDDDLAPELGRRILGPTNVVGIEGTDSVDRYRLSAVNATSPGVLRSRSGPIE